MQSPENWHDNSSWSVVTYINLFFVVVGSFCRMLKPNNGLMSAQNLCVSLKFRQKLNEPLHAKFYMKEAT
jgi:hypothetical protein